MNILFLSYWGIEEGLTQATVLPHVKLLASFNEVDTVVLATIERHETFSSPVIENVVHVPLVSKNHSNVLVNKVNDFVAFRRKIVQLVRLHDIKLMICRSSLAGGIGYLVHRATHIPYVVESYEPHAQYMWESGVWHRADPRY